MGWAPRKVHNVQINGLYVIHSRYRRDETEYVPSAIIGASTFYDSSSSAEAVRPQDEMCVHISNLICEGPSPALLRINPLQSFHLVIEDVHFTDGLQGVCGVSRVKPLPGAPDVQLRLNIVNWTIGGEHVSMANFQHDKLGKLDIDASYWGQWVISRQVPSRISC